MLISTIIFHTHFITAMYFRVFVNESSDLACRTEKDKHGRLNFRTAGKGYVVSEDFNVCTVTIVIIVGIMAGMRPCGMIALFLELFISESLPQVYMVVYINSMPVTLPQLQ